MSRVNAERHRAIGCALYEYSRDCGVRCVAASQGGSRSIGLAGPSSDYDVYFIYDGEGLPNNVSLTLNGDLGDVHLVLASLNEVLASVEGFRANLDRLPSYHSRSESEARHQASLNMYEREEYGRSLAYFTMLGPERWFVGSSLEAAFQELGHALCRASILDFYYTKAMGNIDTFVRGHKTLPCRRCLIPLQELLYCSAIIGERAMPPMDFMTLLERAELSESAFEKFCRLHQMNSQSVDKDTCLVPTDAECTKTLLLLANYVREAIPKFTNSFFLLSDLRKELGEGDYEAN